MKYFLVCVILSVIWLPVVTQPTGKIELVHECAAAKRLRHNTVSDRAPYNQTSLLDQYDVKFYHLNLNVEDTTTYLSGNTLIYAASKVSSLNTFAFELIDEMNIDSVLVNGINHSFIHTSDQVFVNLSQPVSLNELFEVNVFYRGMPPVGDFFNGVNIDTNTTWNTSVVWTLSEPFNARQWFPVKQVLSDKADSVWVFLTTSAGNKAGSNGLLTNEVTLPDKRIRFEWKSSYPITYYLISYSVADYLDYSIYAKPAALQGDSLLIQNYIYSAPGCLEQFKTGIDRTVDFMELFYDKYGPYPFQQEKYGHCLAEIKGGMEHQTMTTLNSFGFIVAHELAHMWFGNNVTCATWSDIWVNEGFATYSDYYAHEKISTPYWTAQWLRLAHDYVISEPGGSVYIPPDEISPDNVERIFSSRLSYYKGAYLLHMIRYEIDNDELFFESFRNYQEAFQDSVATALDYLNILNQTTGKDFTSFFEQWFFGEGYPTYIVDWEQENNFFQLTLNQSASMPDITPFFEQEYPVKLFMQDGTDTTLRVHQNEPIETISLVLPAPVDSLKIDPDLWALKKVVSINGFPEIATNAGIVLSPNPATGFITVVTQLTDPYEVRIINMAGEVMLLKISTKQAITIITDELNPGVYLLIVKSEQQSFAGKFIKY